MKNWIILIVVILALVGAGAYRILGRKKPAESIDKIQMRQGVPVRVHQVGREDLEEAVSISGSIAALRTVTMAPIINERIAQIHFSTGEKVTPGQLLVSFDTTDAKLAVARAEASLNQAEQQLTKLRNGARPEEIETVRARMEQGEAVYNLCAIELKRQEGLYKEEATTLQQLQEAEGRCASARADLAAGRAQYELIKKGPREEDIKIAETQVELARAALGHARKNLANHYLRAPSSGVVSLCRLEAGDVVDRNVAMFTIAYVDEVYLEVDVSELHIAHLQIGMPTMVTIDSLAGRSFTGRIAEINPVANENDRSYLTRILIDNAEGVLRPGMFGRARIASGGIKDALAVPGDAVKNEGGQFYLLLVDENSTARRIDITLGKKFGKLVEVLSGLDEGAKVITFSRGLVQDGSKVSVAEEGDLQEQGKE